MTLSKLSDRPVALAIAGALLGAAAFVVPQLHAQPAPPFAVELATSAAKPMAIVRGTVFRCAGTQCTGGLSESPPRLVCRDVVRQFGHVTRFAIDGRDLDAAALAACNAVA